MLSSSLRTLTLTQVALLFRLNIFDTRLTRYNSRSVAEPTDKLRHAVSLL